MGDVLLLFRKPESDGDISGVNSNACRMARCVLVSSVESSHQRSSKREASTLQTSIGRCEIISKAALLLVENE